MRDLYEMNQAVSRICEMEQTFDALQAAWQAGPAALEGDAVLKNMLAMLVQYYEGGQWMADYMLDAQGKLPPELKRGVLSEDGLWNLLCEIGPIR